MDNLRSETAKAPLVCILAYDGLAMFEFGIALEIFALPRPEFPAWYRHKVIAAEPGPMRATGGIDVVAEHDLAALSQADLILVPGWRGMDAPVLQPLIDALQAASGNGARIASICSGVFVLAAAGLLNGRRATTHWRYTDVLAKRFPEVDVQPDVLFIDNGPVLTSAGSAAGIDLCLHLVRQDFGAAHANIVAKRLVMAPMREGGQSQFIPAPVPRERGGTIAPLLDRVRSSIDRPWTVGDMAREAGMSERTLMRRMVEATGETPQKWLARQRVAYAADLLETTTASLDDIAATAGFQSPETFRRLFRTIRGISPSQHRKSFAATERV
ncbi:transcriptional regulator FtrA [Pelagovum pacificum]|nr:transcriptional regulator FtrA [Pelagovum pacificum]